MSKSLLAVPHRVEAFAGACLPAYLQMALAFIGVNWPQERVAGQLGHIAGAGTLARNVTRLNTPGTRVRYMTNGALEDVQASLAREEVPVLFVRTGELPYWEEDTTHAVLVVGLDADIILINGPAFEQAPIPVPVDDFSLAWYELGNTWAVVARR